MARSTEQLWKRNPPFPPAHQDRPALETRSEPTPRCRAPAYRGADRLLGMVALITGGESGIGRAVAVLFAREGADIAITFLPEELADAEETRHAVEGEGRVCVLIPGDLSLAGFCYDAVDLTVRRFGKLDLLINNAAFQQQQEQLEDLTDEQLDDTFKSNIYATIRLTRAALPHLRPGAAIINTGSITGLEGSGKLLDYSATKGAIHSFTRSLAQNLVERRIRVNCVALGPAWAPLNGAEKPEETGQHRADTPMDRPAQPEEVAPAFVFFASAADSSYITGEVLTLLGGETTAD
ncbi:MAG TPA: SDR family oxidoreductase [Gemmatimonadales bacterium]|nr:SDR family oxidoreductase [Gemmatimonadales bacterium]